VQSVWSQREEKTVSSIESEVVMQQRVNAIDAWPLPLQACVVCDESIDDFHQAWFYTDVKHTLRVHAHCGAAWNDLLERMRASGEPFE
jgi:hypothetical protein